MTRVTGNQRPFAATVKRNRHTLLVVEALESRRLLAATSHLSDGLEFGMPTAPLAAEISHVTLPSRRTGAGAFAAGQDYGGKSERSRDLIWHYDPTPPESVDPAPPLSSVTLLIRADPRPYDTVDALRPTFDPVSIANNRIASRQRPRIEPVTGRQLIVMINVSIPTAMYDVASQYAYVDPHRPAESTVHPAPNDVQDRTTSRNSGSRSRHGNRDATIGSAIRRDFATVFEASQIESVDVSNAFGGLIELSARPSVLASEHETAIDQQHVAPDEDQPGPVRLDVDQPWFSLGSWRYIDGKWTECLPHETDELTESPEHDAESNEADEKTPDEDLGPTIDDTFADWDADPELGGMIAFENSDTVEHDENTRASAIDASLASVRLELDASIGNAMVLELIDNETESESTAVEEPPSQEAAEAKPEVDLQAEPLANIKATSAASLPALLLALRRPLSCERPNSKRKRPSRRRP